MKVNKQFLTLTIMLSLVFPMTTNAETQVEETKVGIGFQTEQPAPKPTPIPSDPQPVPINNVLPATFGQTRYSTQFDQPQVSKGTLPKTGEQRQVVFLQFIGLVCVASCFWLFLFTRLREEEEHA